MNIETFDAKEAKALTMESDVRREELSRVLYAIRDTAIKGDEQIEYNKPMNRAIRRALTQKGFGITDGLNHSIQSPSYIICW